MIVSMMKAYDIGFYNTIRSTLENIEVNNKRFLHVVTTDREIGACHIVVAGKRYINMSSNDYLGLRHHPFLLEQAVLYTNKYGASSSASRLVTGTFDIHKNLERDLAKFKGTEKALLFTSGFQANSAILSTLTNKRHIKEIPAVFADKLNHASMHEGLVNIRQNRYRHLDMEHFDSLVSRCENVNKMAVTESVFSMDGDKVDVKKWSDICKKNGVLSFLDEAHSGGVMGDEGKGLACNMGVDIVMGTFGKAWGSFGAYVAVDAMLYDFFVNTCRGFIYTTALPPAVVGSIQAGLKLIPTLEKQRVHLKKMAEYVRETLKTYGYTTAGTTHIISVIIGENQATLKASEVFRKRGIWICAIRPPTVPIGLARLRIALSALHTNEHIETMLAIFKEMREKF